MPRSIVKIVVGTYHEAIFYLLPISRSLPTTKAGNKFTKASLTYLSGHLGLPFGVTVQEIYSHLEELYTLPPEFLTWLRVINVGKSGKKTPAIYGTVNECKLKVTAVLDNISPDLLNEEPDPLNEEPDELGEGCGGSYSEGEWELAGGQYHNESIHAPNIDNGLESYPEEVSTRAARVRAESVEQWGEEVTNLIYGFAESIQREVDNGDIYGDSDSYSGYDLDSDDEDLEGEL